MQNRRVGPRVVNPTKVDLLPVGGGPDVENELASEAAFRKFQGDNKVVSIGPRAV